jgi:hypothetical protein
MWNGPTFPLDGLGIEATTGTTSKVRSEAEPCSDERDGGAERPMVERSQSG